MAGDRPAGPGEERQQRAGDGRTQSSLRSPGRGAALQRSFPWGWGDILQRPLFSSQLLVLGESCPKPASAQVRARQSPRWHTGLGSCTCWQRRDSLATPCCLWSLAQSGYVKFLAVLEDKALIRYSRWVFANPVPTHFRLGGGERCVHSKWQGLLPCNPVLRAWCQAQQPRGSGWFQGAQLLSGCSSLP